MKSAHIMAEQLLKELTEKRTILDKLINDYNLLKDKLNINKKVLIHYIYYYIIKFI